VRLRPTYLHLVEAGMNEIRMCPGLGNSDVFGKALYRRTRAPRNYDKTAPWPNFRVRPAPIVGSLNRRSYR
jgi:hypothetical protein